MYESAEVYYNYYGNKTCLNIFNSPAFINSRIIMKLVVILLDMNGWDYLACTMVAMP